MQADLLYLLLVMGGVCLSVAFCAAGLFVARLPPKRLFPSVLRWRQWLHSVVREEDENWGRLLRRAGYPFGWGKAEWLAVQWFAGGLLFLVLIVWSLFRGQSLSLFATCLIPGAGFLAPYMVLRWWAGYREELLSVDIARFLNRYVTLLENHVPAYTSMVKAARHTRLLKLYVPSLSEWNRDRFAALETFKRQLGVDDAVLLVSHMRTIDQLSPEVMASAMNRLEWTVDNRRMFRHRKKIKSLGIGYSIIVYPAFYTGLIVAMFPWYKLLTEILDRYLV